MPPTDAVAATPVPSQVPRGIRLGLVLGAPGIPTWLASALTEAGRQAGAAIAHVCVTTAPPPLPITPGPAALLWYANWDRGRQGAAVDPFELQSLPPEVLAADCVHSGSLKELVSHAAAAGLDVILGYGLPVSDLVGLSELIEPAVWWYAFGSGSTPTADTLEPLPDGLGEMGAPAPVARAALVASQRGILHTVIEAWTAADSYSLHRGRSVKRRVAAELLPVALRKPRTWFASLIPASAADPGASRPALPSPAALLPALAVRRVIAGVRERVLRPQWFMAVGENDPHDIATWSDWSRFSLIMPPRDRFWADPFCVEADGRELVFFEELRYAEPRGRICVGELMDQTLVRTRVVIERPYHLSYPCVFRWNGTWYMVPETSEHRTIELHRALDFPDTWELDRILLDDIYAVDATPFEHDGRWWMFASVSGGPVTIGHMLMLYGAPTPLGPWWEHPASPLRIDVRGGRPAGGVIKHSGGLLRPAQDGTRGYGGSLRLYRISRLDQESYAEEEIMHVEPNWRRGLVGTHTLNRAGRHMLVDGLWWRPLWGGTPPPR